MKKLNYLLIGFAGLALASCSQDDITGPAAPGEGNFHLTVKLPKSPATRAISDGLTATNLNYAVYDADNNNSFIFQDQGTFVIDGNRELTANVDFNFVTNKNYTIVFFAQSAASENTAAADVASNGVYDFDGEAGTVTVNYNNMSLEGNSADDYDCFYGTYEVEFAGTTTSDDLTLYRPVARINWCTSDLDEETVESIFGEGGEYIQSVLTTRPYTQLNLLNGEVSEQATSDMNLPMFGIPGEGEVSPVEDYDWIAYQYLLVPSAQSVLDFSINFSNTGNSQVTQATNVALMVPNAPVQANYLTNIYGALLTDNTTLTVTKSAEWGGKYDVEQFETFTEDLTAPGTYSITEDGIYKLNGNLVAEGANINTDTYVFNLSSGINAIIDGSGLSCATEGKTFHLVFQDNDQFPHAQDNIITPSAITGTLTFQNFTGGNISIKTGNTNIVIKDNTITALDLGLGNVNLTITGNNFVDDGQSHPRWDNVMNKYTAYMYMIRYNMTFNNNTMTGNTQGSPIQINGWMSNDPNGSWSSEELYGINSIPSFSGNTLVVDENETNPDSWTAAIAFMGDATFYLENVDGPVFSSGMNTFMELVNNSNNNFYVGENVDGGYKFKATTVNSVYNARVQSFTEKVPADNEND